VLRAREAGIPQRSFLLDYLSDGRCMRVVRIIMFGLEVVIVATFGAVRLKIVTASSASTAFTGGVIIEAIVVGVIALELV
jgi:hypothetical protein